MSLSSLVTGFVSSLLPAGSADGTEKSLRVNRYGEGIVSPIFRTKHPLANEGSFFVTGNPTLGTSLAYAVVTSFTDTVAAFVFQNTADASVAPYPALYLDYIKLIYTVAPASATGLQYVVRLDTGNRAPTAGSTQLTGQGGSPGASPVGYVVKQSVAKIWAFTGASLTVPASVNARTVAQGGISGLPVVTTEHMIRFGDSGANLGGAAGGTSHAAPVIVPPGQFCVVHLWYPSNATTPASVALDIGWAER